MPVNRAGKFNSLHYLQLNRFALFLLSSLMLCVFFKTSSLSRFVHSLEMNGLQIIFVIRYRGGIFSITQPGSESYRVNGVPHNQIVCIYHS